jgi:ABC-type glycerol-3-phosphate transport system permease component
MAMTMTEVRRKDEARTRRQARARFFLTKSATYILLILGAILVMIPFYWLLRTSLMWEGDIFLYPPKWLPIPPAWENYVSIFQTKGAPMGDFWKNTIIMVILSAIGDIFSASLVAYSLARIPWRGRTILFVTVVATMFLPGQVTIIPTFLLWKYLGGLNTLIPLIVPSWLGHPFYLFLMRQFVMTIPAEMDDAARIDGCGVFGIYRHVILPLSLPGLATIAIFAYQSKWNQFFLPLIYINTKEKLPLAVGLYYFRSMVGSGFVETTWSHLMAAATLSVLPILLIFFFAQRFFIQGIVVSGVKG